jgi:hypothetical protein
MNWFWVMTNCLLSKEETTIAITQAAQVAIAVANAKQEKAVAATVQKEEVAVAVVAVLPEMAVAAPFPQKVNESSLVSRRLNKRRLLLLVKWVVQSPSR